DATPKVLKVFRSVPFLRILMPYLSGVIIARFFQPPADFRLLLLFPLLYILSRYLERKGRMPVHTVPLITDVFLFYAALVLVQHGNLSRREDFFMKNGAPETRVEVVAVTTDLIVQKNKWQRVEMDVTQ